MNKEDQNETRKGLWAYYIKVNGSYYKKVAFREPSGDIAFRLTATSVAAIKEDLSSDDIKLIPQYDGFANIPENDPDSYHRIVYAEKDGIQSALYNLYSPVCHRPAAGEWNNIDKVLRHLFGGDDYQKAILYLKNLYINPAMRQPILFLLGKEQATGKTTFLQLLKAIFSENMRIMGYDSFGMYNDLWAGKLIIGIEEEYADYHRPTMRFTLNSINANSTITLKRKGSDAETLPNFTKIIVCSQDGRFANMISDIGGWICPVSTIQVSELDPLILDKIIAEIPAFLEHLIEID